MHGGDYLVLLWGPNQGSTTPSSVLNVGGASTHHVLPSHLRVFFFLSKLLDIVIDPLWWAGGPAVLGLALLVRGERKVLGARLAAFGLGALFFCALPAFSNRLWASLESGAISTFKTDTVYDAVVLLGGAVTPQGSLVDAPAWNDNFERVLEVRQLLVTGQAKVAIVSGGKLGGDLRTEAEYLADELVLLGVPREQVLVEAKANNTRENATLSKVLLEKLGAKKVLLVTSAFHVPRAAGCFRAAGVEADMLPVDFRLRDPGADQHWLPRGEYLSQTTRALREWLGRLVYRVLGYTK
jgi:uncharacterized SAM-binding protein YcdF (DUF218 family)